MSVRHIAAVAGSALLVFGLAIAAIVAGLHFSPLPDTTLLGAVVVSDADPAKQRPIPNAHIAARLGRTSGRAISEPTGFFRMNLPTVLRLGRPISLSVTASGFQPALLNIASDRELVVIRLLPIPVPGRSPQSPGHTLSNVRVRYTVRTESYIDVGAVVKPFQAINEGNQPCHANPVCSPGGEWKAALGRLTLDAGQGNHFRSPRVSCIAGPCSFTRIETEALHQNDRSFEAVALNWSDTATFLVEADVVHTQITDMVRQAFPIIFGQGLSFTLPSSAAGPIIQAELDGQDIFFPLGPDLRLSWATCSASPSSNSATLYSCDLKPNFRFS